MESVPLPHHAEKAGRYFSLPAGSKAACVKLQKEQVSITYLMPSQENNAVQPLGRLNSLYPEKLKNVSSELQSNTTSRGGGRMLNLPQITGWGKEPNSVLNSQ
jgi:hypothetical protein